MNKKFLFIAIVATVVANCAIVGCNRQTPSNSSADNNVAKPSETIPTSAQTSPPANAVTDTSKPKEVEMQMPPKSAAKPEKSPYEKSDIEIKIFKVDPPNSGFGYDVSIDKHPYLHQYNVPGVPGNNGFSSEQNAHKAAEFVVNKIRHNIMPPTVDSKELDSLGVLK